MRYVPSDKLEDGVLFLGLYKLPQIYKVKNIPIYFIKLHRLSLQTVMVRKLSPAPPPPLIFSEKQRSRFFFLLLELRQYKNNLVSVKRMFVLKLPPLYSSPTRQGEKGGNFKTNMRFTETNPFLYCLSSLTTLVLELCASKNVGRFCFTFGKLAHTCNEK